MAYRFFSVPAVALAIAAFAGAESAGQAPSAAPVPRTGRPTATAGADLPSAEPASKSTWTPTRTLDGQPDLQGYWTNATFTPLERPAEFAGKEFFTPEEAAAFEKQRVDSFLGQAADNIHYDDAIWQTETYKKGVCGLRGGHDGDDSQCPDHSARCPSASWTESASVDRDEATRRAPGLGLSQRPRSGLEDAIYEDVSSRSGPFLLAWDMDAGCFTIN